MDTNEASNDASEMLPGSRKARQWIEGLLNEALKEVAKGKGGAACVRLRRIEGYEARLNQDTFTTEFTAKDHEVKYCWPGKTPDEAWRFACSVAILNSIHAAICSNVIVTKRDIYYSDPDLFGDQAVVDSLIDDIAHTGRLSRGDLHVIASPKGLFATPSTANGRVQTITKSLPTLGTVAWVLVVEKEATFNALHEAGFQNFHRAGPGLIVTAKGYPDLATRGFLRSCLDTPGFSAPLFGLFDYDPYGVDILKCYRIGSKASAVERRLNLPEIVWLGIKTEDIAQLAENAVVMSLSPKDRIKALKIIDSTTIAGGMVVEELRDCRDELQRMLMLNQKAEIQVLEERVCGWTEDKMLAVMSTG